jgi:pyruvate kinase
VQRPEDVAEVKAIVDGRALVMSKIEKPQALTRLDEIISLSDGLMVARGDLGVELPLEKVPGIQKRITRRARRQGKPVVIATQMLESMINAAMPTRAEVSDVAQAVFEGADAIMLSAESAVGKYPVEAVSFMDRIATEVETDPLYRSIISAQRAPPEPTAADAIAVAARDMAETLELKVVVAWTSTGATAFRIARERVGPPILALTPHVETARRLAMVWGVHMLVTKDAEDVDDMVDRACVTADSEGFAEAGDRIIIIGGVPFGERGGTNMMRIALLKNPDDEIPTTPLPDTPLLD